MRLSADGSAINTAEYVGKNRKRIQLSRFKVANGRIKDMARSGWFRRLVSRCHRLLCDLRVKSWPLLFSVIKGDLSLIGPRPETPEVVAMYDETQLSVLSVRPGIWGPSSSKGDIDYDEGRATHADPGKWKAHYYENILPEKLKDELHYAQNRFLSRDLKVISGILKRTVSRSIHSQLMREAKDRNFFLPLDLFLVFCSYLISYHLRFEWSLPDNDYIILFKSLPFILFLRIVTFYSFGLYKNLWKYVGVRDLVTIIRAVSMSSILCVTAIFLFGVSEHSRSIFLIDWLLCIMFIGGARLVIRLFNESVRTEQKLRKNVLIIGAGDVGEMLLRELNKGGRDTYNVVGFVDDDDSIHGRTIHGIKVMGNCLDIPEIVQLFRIDEALITFNHFSSEQMKTILGYCKQGNVRHRVVPAVSDVLSGTLHLSRVREVEISDLFGRDAVELDLSAINKSLNGKRVLVTGAGGSIGSELCRQIAEYEPACLVLVDKNENYLHEIYCELRASFETMEIHCSLTDITNRTKQERVFQSVKPEIVFHAAAQKHVPLSEENPEEAVINNVVGTKNIAELSDKFGVLAFVMVSTDKAVNPTSVMGTTKRIAELFVQALSQKSQTKFVTVRFGNVLNSNGSVVPIFTKQIERGGPVTVTHPVVERYFMSISEAVQLILQAATMGNDCEIFILNMGKSIRIVDLAVELIKHAGLKPYEDIQIKFTGLRPGEKLFEELIGNNEKLLPTSHADINKLKSKYAISLEQMEKDIAELIQAAYDNQTSKLMRKLADVVPEYRPDISDTIPEIPSEMMVNAPTMEAQSSDSHQRVAGQQLTPLVQAG